MAIPARVHFCWIGASLPWAYAFAVLSAARRSGLPEVILHHTDDLADDVAARSLGGIANVRLARLDAVACVERVDRALGTGGRLAALYRATESAVTRADILRAAILWQQGGVYLDLDTVTTASLSPLLGVRQFVGCEYIVWPLRVRASRSALVWARHLTLDVARKVMREMPGGWKAFRRVERFYVRGINNAVMGAEARAPLVAVYLRAMVELPPAHAGQPYALGPDLLQEVVDRHRQGDLVVHEPAVFYPLPPEISTHWFRIVPRVRLESVLSEDTRVVHWYASVRGKVRIEEITPGYVRRHQEDQLYSALVCACVGELPDAP
jgi:hypothetical protein